MTGALWAIDQGSDGHAPIASLRAAARRYDLTSCVSRRTGQRETLLGRCPLLVTIRFVGMSFEPLQMIRIAP